MADTHLHQCPGCQESVECSLAIGDPECGKLRCAGCSGPKLKPNTSKRADTGQLLSNTWICVNGCEQYDNTVNTCGKCGTSKPKAIGRCINCNWPISEYHPDKCWSGHPQAEEVTAADLGPEDEEDKVYTCPTCDEEHEDDVVGVCSKRGCTTEVCPECQKECYSCSNNFCEDHSNWCHCCEVNVCDNCSNNHGT